MNNKFFYSDEPINNVPENNVPTPNNVVNTPMPTPNNIPVPNQQPVPSAPSTPVINQPKKKIPILFIIIGAVVLLVVIVVIILLMQNQKETTYYCDEGYKLVGDICTITVTERPTYDLGCPEDYEYSGVSHKCEKYVEEIPYYRLECESGFILNNENKCEGDKPTAAKKEFTCTNGELTGETCVNKTKNNKVLICNNYCPEGLTPTEDKKTCYKRQKPDPSKGCPSGKGWTTESNGQCYYAEQASCNYSCPQGYLFEADSCFLVETKKADYILTCPEGTVLTGSKCNIPTIKNPKSVNFCDADAKLNKEKTKCIKTLYKEIGDVATCQKGWTLEGNMCTKIETKPANKK